MRYEDTQGHALPLCNREAEAAVLTSILRDKTVIADVLVQLGEADFGIDAHQRVFAAVSRLFQAGQPIDLVTLAEDLLARKELGDVGGPAYLAELWEGHAVPANVGRYSGIVRDRSLRRRLRAAAVQIAADADDGSVPAEELRDAAERSIFALAGNQLTGRTISFGQAVQEACQLYDARLHGGERGGVRVRIDALDAITGGFRPGELIVLAARPSVGKTTLGLWIVLHAALDGHPVFFVSLEQKTPDLATRLLACHAGVDASKFRRLTMTPSEVERVLKAKDRIFSIPGNLNDASPQKILHIAASARRVKARHGLSLLVIDYLGLIEPESRREPRHEQVACISRRLKQLALELDVPVLALAQLNRASEERSDGLPRLSDLRESGAIEADADTVILLHRPLSEKGRPDGLLNVLVEKQRNGPTGRFSLVFRRDLMRFESCDDVPD